MSSDGEMVGVAEEAAPARTGTLGYTAGLDGLRGIAVLAIIVYHAGLPWMPGAFLSVSTFFTLSGFLITAVMLGEHGRRGQISLGRFWARRFRRLLPAALVAIAAIVATAAVLADGSQLARLRGDALASLFYVANWRFIALGDAYGRHFASPSPFTHFWTLSIEEQFYVVFPLLLVGILAAARGNRRVLAAALGGVATLSVAWSAYLLHHGSTVDRIYFGTDTRAAELLTGALLALWWMRRPDPVAERARRPIQVLGVVALVAVLGLWATASLNQRWYYEGGLAAYSLLTLVVLLAALQHGVVARVLSVRPLVAVGVVSYGAYLFHWPIFVWLQIHTSLKPGGRFLVGLPATLAVAFLSYHLVERPIREGRRLVAPRARLAGPIAIGATFALIVGVTATRPGHPTYDFNAALAKAQKPLPAAFTHLTPAQQKQFGNYIGAVSQHEQLAATGAPTVTSYGDSTALVTGVGLSTYVDDQFARHHKALLVPVPGWARLGCGLITTGRHVYGGQPGTPEPLCRDWIAAWARAAKQNPVDIAYVEVGTWDVLDQQPAGFHKMVSIGDRGLDELLRSQLNKGIAALEGQARLIVLALSPDIDTGRIDGHSPDSAYPESNPARMARFRQLLQSVARQHPNVATVDLAGWLSHRPDERQLRPDGVHLTPAAAIKTASWLAPELLRIWQASGLDAVHR